MSEYVDENITAKKIKDLNKRMLSAYESDELY